MNKPQSLRLHLEQAFSYLAQNPESLLVFVDTGAVQVTLAKGLSFEYSYKLNIILTDFAGDIDVLMVALLDWIRVNQSEILANLELGKNAVQFEADILDNGKVDLSIVLPLTERVIVKRDGNRLDMSYPPEPQYTAAQSATNMTLYDAQGNELLQWQSKDTEDEYFLETPWTKRHG